jgi:transposase
MPAAFETYFQKMPPLCVAIETGTHSGWISRLLRALGHEVVVANARELRKIHQSTRKNDRADAEILARMVRFDPQLLAPIHHRSAQMQVHITVLRARDTVVGARTKLINAVRGLVKASGHRLPGCSAESFAHCAAEHTPSELQPALAPLISTIATLTAQIRSYDRQIETLAAKCYPETELLKQIQGVGPVTSLAFILTLSDKARFTHSRDVGAYLGLVPRQYDSGESRSQLHITKAGNPFLRRLLVGCAQYILGRYGPDCNLRRYGERLAQRGGKNAKKRAVVAVARKLAVLLHHLWRCGTVYEPLYGQCPTTTAASAA